MGRLPGGRAPRFSRDAYTGQMADYDARRQSVPQANGGFLTALGPFALPVQGATLTPATGGLYAYPLPTLDREYHFVQARISVATFSSAATLYTGIYAVGDNPKLGLYPVANSRGVFAIASTGVKTAALPGTCVLTPHKQYYMAFVSTGTTFTLATYTGATTYSMPLAAIFAGGTYVGGDIAKPLFWDNILTTAASGKRYVPDTAALAYLSTEASKLM